METSNPSKIRLWISYILQGAVVLIFLMAGVMNVLQTETAVSGAVEMGYPSSAVFYLGIVLLLNTLLYALPKTSIIGAILLTGWLGGAVATHVIHGDPMMNIIFPVIIGIIVWLCIWLRNGDFRSTLGF